jgi:Zn-dependent protease
VLRGNSLRLGRVLGIEVKLDYSWFIVFALVTFSLAGEYFPSTYPGWSRAEYWLTGITTAVLFFLSVLAHELAHSVVSQASGVPVKDITLFIFGGAAQISDEPKTAGGEFRMALVGPLTSLALSLAFWVLGFLGAVAGPILGALSYWLARINLSLALFNLIPGFPLDGGRVLRALLWAATRNLKRATLIATSVGRLVAYGFIFFGVWQFFRGNWADGLWIAFIGWFVENAAAASYRRVALREILAGHTVRELMTNDCVLVPRHYTLDTLVDEVILPTGRRCFPVSEDNQLYGLVTVHRINQVPRSAWKQTRAEQVMIPRAELKSVGPDDDLNQVLERMAAEDVNQFLVLSDGKLLGMLARDRLLNFIQVRSELGV